MTAFSLSREARRDIRSIRGYLTSKGEDAWDIVIDRLHSAMQRIGGHRHIGGLRPEVTKHGYRFFLAKPYIIVYDPRTTPVTIAAGLHSAQDIKKQLRRRR